MLYAVRRSLKGAPPGSSPCALGCQTLTLNLFGIRAMTGPHPASLVSAPSPLLRTPHIRHDASCTLHALRPTVNGPSVIHQDPMRSTTRRLIRNSDNHAHHQSCFSTHRAPDELLSMANLISVTLAVMHNGSPDRRQGSVGDRNPHRAITVSACCTGRISARH